MFAFSALLKRQFLLCKRKIFTLILTFFILYAIYGIMLFSGDSVDIMKFETANLVFKMVFSVILTTSFVTTLVDDLRKKNKNINIAPVNVYLINFTYLAFSFLVNFFVKLFFSLLFYVFIFFKIKVFYYQTIYFILLESFLFTLTVSTIEIFFSFFCFKFLRISKIFFTIFCIFSFFVEIIPFIPKYFKLSPNVILVRNQMRTFLSIMGLRDFFCLTNEFILDIIILLITLSLMLFIQNIFVFIYNEKKFNSKK